MKKDNLPKLNIKEWAEEDRPREKLSEKGTNALSDAELLAILIGSGNKNETAVELAQRILYGVSNNLNALGKLSIKDLKKHKGIGEAKAVTIVAALELGRRRKLSESLIDLQISSSKDIYDIIHPVLADLSHEETWILLVNQSNKIIKRVQLSKGGISATVVDVRMIMKEVIDNLATAFVLCHNHPSGNIQPSSEDNLLTYKLKEASTLLDVRMLDHLIVCDNSYYSYADEGKI